MSAALRYDDGWMRDTISAIDRDHGCFACTACVERTAVSVLEAAAAGTVEIVDKDGR